MFVRPNRLLLHATLALALLVVLSVPRPSTAQHHGGGPGGGGFPGGMRSWGGGRILAISQRSLGHEPQQFRKNARRSSGWAPRSLVGRQALRQAAEAHRRSAAAHGLPSSRQNRPMLLKRYENLEQEEQRMEAMTHAKTLDEWRSLRTDRSHRAGACGPRKGDLALSGPDPQRARSGSDLRSSKTSINSQQFIVALITGNQSVPGAVIIAYALRCTGPALRAHRRGHLRRERPRNLSRIGRTLERSSRGGGRHARGLGGEPGAGMALLLHAPSRRDGCPTQRGAPGTGRHRSSRWAIASTSAPRTSTTCTSAPARIVFITCTASSFSRAV